MCGIAALIRLRPGANLAGIGPMTDLIRHRGPDDEGFALFFDERPALPMGGADTPPSAFDSGLVYAPEGRFDASVATEALAALGHRRLSILDLSDAGHQPMASEDSRFWITYNGEIYNYRELRSELEGAGHRFATHTDTEVILAAYAEWGADCLHRFNGMWAFVLLDRQEGRVFAARDRFGVKPLYYWVSSEGFLALASEIKQFTVLPGWQARVNGQRAYDFLAWGMLDHTGETLFHGVRQLRGGEAFETRLETLGAEVPVYRWYTLEPRPFEGDMAAASRSFEELLRDAVSLRLRADVPVGSCLSGGLDSSSIVCLANDLLGDSAGLQKTFSACSDIKRFDEREYIDEVVLSRRIDSRTVTPALDGLFEALRPLTWHQDEPFGSTSIYAQWHVFKLAASNGVKVMLDGQGADEQLAGYHGFFGARFAQLFRTLRWRTLWKDIKASERLHGYGAMSALRMMATVLLPEALQAKIRRTGGTSTSVPDWLNLETLGALPLHPIAARGRMPRTIQEISHAQLTATNLPLLLHWEDRDSMAHSIESRVPFLDYRLVEFVLGLPDDFKLSEGVTKRVQREAMRGILPERIRMRMDKMGFVTPEETWVREQSPERFRQALAEAVMASRGILNEAALPLLERMITGQAPFSFVAWRLISFGQWMEAFDVRPMGKLA